MFIAVNRFISAVNYGELSQMFGFDSITDFVKNDPFSSSDKRASQPRQIHSSFLLI